MLFVKPMDLARREYHLSQIAHLPRQCLSIFLGISLTLIGAVQAKAVVLNFDPPQIAGTGLSAMPNSPGAAVPSTARLSNQFLTTSGVVFSSDSPYVALINIEAGYPGNAPTPPNGIGGVASGTLAYSAPIVATFFLPSNPAIQAITNFVSVKADTIGLGGTISLQAFNTSGALIGNISAIDSSGPTMSLSVAGIHSVRITGTPTTGFDDFTFNNLSPAPSATTPEPSPILGILTLGLLGIAAVRQRHP